MASALAEPRGRATPSRRWLDGGAVPGGSDAPQRHRCIGARGVQVPWVPGALVRPKTRSTAMQRTVERMLRTSPEPPFAPADPLSACIHACVECAQACTACADACVAEHDRVLDACI